MFAILVVCGGFSAMATTDIQPNGNLSGGNTAANCTQPVLGTYSGSANFEAKWRANEVPIRWYSEGEVLTNVQDAAKTCTYDGALNIPSVPPTRVGYIFNGWKIDHSCGLKNVDPAISATGRCYKSQNGSNGSHGTCNYTLTKKGTYAVAFNYGIVLGEGLCSTTSGHAGVIGTPNTNDTGNYCWCRITGYVWAEGGVCSTTSGWMYENFNSDDIANGVTCASGCAGVCAYRLYAYDHRRRPLYNSLPE